MCAYNWQAAHPSGSDSGSSHHAGSGNAGQGGQNCGLASLLGPLLVLLQPLLSGLNGGLQTGASQVASALDNAGSLLENGVSAVASLETPTLRGAGQTIAALPGALDHTVKALNSVGAVGSLVKTLTG